MRTLALAILFFARCAFAQLDDVAFVGILTTQAAASAYNYYVDSVGGDDGNSGTSSASPLKTLSALTGKGLVTNNSVALAAGSHWREQLTATNSITISSYGTGERPILDAADVLTNSSFTLVAGKTNVWQITVPLDGLASVAWLNAWENDRVLTNVYSLDLCDGAPGSYTNTATTGSTVTIYIHPSDNSAITNNGKTYEYSKRQFGLRLNAATNTISGLECRRNLHNDGAFAAYGQYNTISNCVFRDGGKHNMLVAGNSAVVDSIATNIWYDGASAVQIVYFQPSGDLSPVSFTRCSTYADRSLKGGSSLITGFYGHTTSGNFGTISYTNCSSVGAGTVFGGINCTNMIFVDCNSTNSGTVLSIGATNSTIIGGFFTNIWTRMINAGNINDSTLNITNTVAYISGAIGVPFVYGNKTRCTFNVNSNWWASINGNGTTVNFTSSGTTNTLNSYSNVFTAGSWYYDLANTTYTLNSDYNSFPSHGTGNKFRFNAVAYTWTNYTNTFYPNDSHSQ